MGDSRLIFACLDDVSIFLNMRADGDVGAAEDMSMN
jgi:hypothetical protein